MITRGGCSPHLQPLHSGMDRIHQWLVLMFIGVAAIAADKKDDDDSKPFSLSEPISHLGCCDASAGVAVSSNLFLMANDEDNLLRVYRRDKPGPPVQAFQTGQFLHVDPRKPESRSEERRVGKEC